MKMGFLSIDHVQLAMPRGEEDRARQFYRDFLGLAETPKPAHLAQRGGIWFESGAVRLHLGVDEAFLPARKAHPAFLVENLEALIVKGRAIHHPIERDGALEGYDRAYIDDPFGNRLEFMQKL